MILQTIIFSVSSLIILFILTKLMGYRQITQLSMYDYIIGITIGSIAAEMVVLTDYNDVLRPIIGMFIYCLFTILLSVLSRNSLKLRHFIEGNPLTLYKDDKILSKNLIIAKMDVNELLMQLRIQGYFDLTQIDTIILETNGRISIFPKTKYRPTIVDDFSFRYQEEKPLLAIVINGQLLEKQLSVIHKDKEWLLKALKVKGYTDYPNLILVLYNDSNIYVYEKGAVA